VGHHLPAVDSRSYSVLARPVRADSGSSRAIPARHDREQNAVSTSGYEGPRLPLRRPKDTARTRTEARHATVCRSAGLAMGALGPAIPSETNISAMATTTERQWRPSVGPRYVSGGACVS
jgi:hypothetical protein